MYISYITGHSMQRPQPTPKFAAERNARSSFNMSLSHRLLPSTMEARLGSRWRFGDALKKLSNHKTPRGTGWWFRNPVNNASVEAMRMLHPWFTGWCSTSNFVDWLFGGMSEPINRLMQSAGHENYSKTKRTTQPVQNAGILGQKSLGVFLLGIAQKE